MPELRLRFQTGWPNTEPVDHVHGSMQVTMHYSIHYLVSHVPSSTCAAAALEAIGKPKEAMQVLRQALEVSPGHSEVLVVDE
jgi:hypothetical protein